jgi:hypothetical protein
MSKEPTSFHPREKANKGPNSTICQNFPGRNKKGPPRRPVDAGANRSHERVRRSRPPSPGLWREIFHLFRVEIWWSRSGSNRRPRRCERRALSTELLAREERDVLRTRCVQVNTNFCLPAKEVRTPGENAPKPGDRAGQNRLRSPQPPDGRRSSCPRPSAAR